MRSLLIQGDSGAPTLILAHGAGQGMDSDFMNSLTSALINHGIRVIRFEFDYRIRQRLTGRRCLPDRQPILLSAFVEVLDQVNVSRPFIGGKSMGGRIASLLAQEDKYAGVVVLGYPFHPQGRPDRLRIDHLNALKTRMLICQGSHDPFGHYQEVIRYNLPRTIEWAWFEQANHDLKPYKRSGYNQHEYILQASQRIAQFMGVE